MLVSGEQLRGKQLFEYARRDNHEAACLWAVRVDAVSPSDFRGAIALEAFRAQHVPAVTHHNCICHFALAEAASACKWLSKIGLAVGLDSAFRELESLLEVVRVCVECFPRRTLVPAVLQQQGVGHVR